MSGARPPCDLAEVRDGIQCADKNLRVAADDLEIGGTYWLWFWGLLFIMPSRGGVKEEQWSPVFGEVQKIQTSYLFIRPPSLF